MTIKTIKSAKCMGDPFQTDNGQLYNQWVEFDDGSKGLAFSQSAQAPYGAGDSVEVTDTGKKTQKGASKLKIKKVQGDTSFGSQSPSVGAQTPSQGFGGDKDKQIQIGMDINNMTRLVASGKTPKEAYALVKQIREIAEGNKVGGGYGPDGKLAVDIDEETEEPPF
jgi:hypothetical protein